MSDTSRSVNTLPEMVSDYLMNVTWKHNPAVCFRKKSTSWLMRAAGWLFAALRINTKFMGQYYTVIDTDILTPDAKLDTPDDRELTDVLSHETIHVIDRGRMNKYLYNFLYMFPQSLAPMALLALGAFWHTNMLWCLLFLLCLAPIPAPFRYWFELRAYRTSIVFARKMYRLNNAQMEKVYDWVVMQLSTSLYYFTWPFPKMIRRHLMDESFMSKPEYKEIVKWIAIQKTLKTIQNNA